MLLMRKINPFRARHLTRLLPLAAAVAASVLLPIAAYAAGPSWEDTLETALQTPLGPLPPRTLCLLAVLWGGLMLKFDKNPSKRILGGILLGLGVAVGAASFIT